MIKWYLSGKFNDLRSLMSTAHKPRTMTTKYNARALTEDPGSVDAWYSDAIECNDTRKSGQDARSTFQFAVIDDGEYGFSVQKIVMTAEENALITIETEMSQDAALELAQRLYHNEMHSVRTNNKHMQVSRGIPPHVAKYNWHHIEQHQPAFT